MGVQGGGMGGYEITQFYNPAGGQQQSQPQAATNPSANPQMRPKQQ